MKLNLHILLLFSRPINLSQASSSEAIKIYFEDFFNEPYRYLFESKELEIISPYLIACLDTKKTPYQIEMHIKSVEKVLFLLKRDNKDQNGNPFLLPNDVDIASNGMIYFSNSSTKVHFNSLNARKILLEIKPDGGLYRYDPNTKQTKTLIAGAFFANGVAVSKNDDFVLMVELSKYRVRRYYLTGDKAGQIDTFIDNLPGLPNGISRRKDGSFWLGFATRRDDVLDMIQPSPFIKKIVYALPLWMQPEREAYGIIMHLSENGKILKTYYDTSGQVVSEASSVEEHGGFLYIGGDAVDHIGKYKRVH